MTHESPKHLATDFFARLDANDVDGALALLADDATWTIVGRPELLPAAGTYDRARIARLLHRMLSQMPDGLRMTVTGMLAEGDGVAVEAESRGELVNGRVYEQRYHVRLAVRDGRIAAVREYLDTQHVFATWFAE